MVNSAVTLTRMYTSNGAIGQAASFRADYKYGESVRHYVDLAENGVTHDQIKLVI